MSSFAFLMTLASIVLMSISVTQLSSSTSLMASSPHPSHAMLMEYSSGEDPDHVDTYRCEGVPFHTECELEPAAPGSAKATCILEAPSRGLCTLTPIPRARTAEQALKDCKQFCKTETATCQAHLFTGIGIDGITNVHWYGCQPCDCYPGM